MPGKLHAGEERNYLRHEKCVKHGAYIRLYRRATQEGRSVRDLSLDFIRKDRERRQTRIAITHAPLCVLVGVMLMPRPVADMNQKSGPPDHT